MKQSSANMLKEGKREIRAIGDVCDPACFPWYACAHSKPNGVCEGFVLMNGETRKHLNRILNEDDAIYIQDCMKTIQRGCDAETRDALVSEVLRYIPPKEPHREGFLGQLEASRRVQNTPAPEYTAPEPQTQTGFLRMLDPDYQAYVAGRSEETHGRIPVGFGEMIEAAFPHENLPTPDDKPHVKRVMGFGAMLEASRRGTQQ